MSSGGELVRLVYAPETEILSETLGTARSRTMRQLRKGALLLRRERLRRTRRKKAEAAATATPKDTASDADKPKPKSKPTAK